MRIELILLLLYLVFIPINLGLIKYIVKKMDKSDFYLSLFSIIIFIILIIIILDDFRKNKH